jgi:hypothetical protein
VVAFGKYFVEEIAVVGTFPEQEGLVGNIVVIVAFGSGFVGGIVNTVEERAGVFICDRFIVAFITFGKAVAGGLVWDGLFVVRGFVFASVFG